MNLNRKAQLDADQSDRIQDSDDEGRLEEHVGDMSTTVLDLRRLTHAEVQFFIREVAGTDVADLLDHHRATPRSRRRRPTQAVQRRCRLANKRRGERHRRR